MPHLLYNEYFITNRNRSLTIFTVSIAVFIVLNLVENVIHYSIGRTHGTSGIVIVAPSYVDWLRITIIMIIFAILQGLLTMALSSNRPNRQL